MILISSFEQAIKLLVTGNSDVFQIILNSLLITGSAIFLAMILGVPLGVLLALRKFKGRGLLLTFVNTGMGLPPVVVGLILSLLLFRSSILGFLNLLYTPFAIILAETIIALPVVAALTASSVQALNPKIRLQLMALGASKWQQIFSIL